MWFIKKNNMIIKLNNKKSELLKKYAKFYKSKNYPEIEKLQAQIDLLEELIYG